MTKAGLRSRAEQHKCAKNKRKANDKEEEAGLQTDDRPGKTLTDCARWGHHAVFSSRSGVGILRCSFIVQFAAIPTETPSGGSQPFLKNFGVIDAPNSYTWQAPAAPFASILAPKIPVGIPIAFFLSCHHKLGRDPYV